MCDFPAQQAAVATLVLLQSTTSLTDGRRGTDSGLVTVAALSAAGPNAPSFRVRTQIPGAELARYGVVVEPLSLLDEADNRRIREAAVPARAATALRARARLRRRLARIDWDVSLVERQVDLLPTLDLER